MIVLKSPVEKKAKSLDANGNKSRNIERVRLDKKNKITRAKKQKITRINIVVALIGELLCLFAIAQAYITQKTAFDLIDSSPFYTDIKLLGYSCFLLLTAGFLALFIALNFIQLANRQRKHLSYISASIGTLFIVLSSGLLLASHKTEQQWWGYFSVITWGAGYVAMMFSDLTEKKQKGLYYFLKIVSLVLMLGGIVLATLG